MAAKRKKKKISRGEAPARTSRRKTETKAPEASARETTEASTSSIDPIAARVQALTGVFTALGAREPERWARSHVQDGIDQIGRFVFLRALWGRIVKDGRFLDKLRREQGELRPVIERLLLAGVDEADLVALVRGMQVRLLVDIAQIIDDPSDNDEGIRWGLWRMDRRGLPLWQLGDLRLDVLEVDPADDL